jgi:hypothetical protein
MPCQLFCFVHIRSLAVLSGSFPALPALARLTALVARCVEWLVPCAPGAGAPHRFGRSLCSSFVVTSCGALGSLGGDFVAKRQARVL